MKNRDLVRKRRKSHWIKHIDLILLSLIMVFPIFWWFFATFKPLSELGSRNILPVKWTLSNYINGWQMTNNLTFGRLFLNTLFIVAINVIGAVASGSLVAYAFGRLDFKFKNFWFSIVMMTLMLPSQVTVVSQYIMYNKLKLVNTYVPLILPYCLGGGAFFIFLLVQFIRGIPKELDESAKCDGASTFCIYLHIIMPLLKAPLTTVAIYAFIWSWDDFYSQMLYLSTPAKFTVGLGLRMLVDQWEIKWGELFAMSLLSILPSLILFFTRQKDFIEGVAASGIKG